MNDILAVYRGPFKNRYGFIRGAAYLLKTQKIIQLGLGFINVIPHTLDGEAASGPLQYWNTVDFGQNWTPMEFYDEETEKELEEETKRLVIEDMNKKIISGDFLKEEY